MATDQTLIVELAIRQGEKSVSITAEDIPLAEAMDVIRSVMAEIIDTELVKVVAS